MWCCLRGSCRALCLPSSYIFLQAAAVSCGMVCYYAGDSCVRCQSC